MKFERRKKARMVARTQGGEEGKVIKGNTLR